MTERVKVQVASAAAAGAGELGGLRASVELKAQQVVALTAELATSAAALRAMEAKLAELEVASLSQKDDRMRSMQDKCDGLQRKGRRGRPGESCSAAVSQSEEGDVDGIGDVENPWWVDDTLEPAGEPWWDR